MTNTPLEPSPDNEFVPKWIYDLVRNEGIRLAAENRALRDRLDQAPHTDKCDLSRIVVDRALHGDCTCWKSVPLPAPTPDTRAEELQAASESASSMTRWGAEQRDRADQAESRATELQARLDQVRACVEDVEPEDDDVFGACIRRILNAPLPVTGGDDRCETVGVHGRCVLGKDHQFSAHRAEQADTGGDS